VSSGGRTTTRLTARTRRDAGGAPTWQTRSQFFDGLGRAIQRYGEAEVGGQSGHLVTNTYRDSRGRVDRSALPFFRTGLSGGFVASEWDRTSSRARTEQSYDARDRSTSLRTWDGVQYLPARTTSYTDRTVAVLAVGPQGSVYVTWGDTSGSPNACCVSSGCNATNGLDGSSGGDPACPREQVTIEPRGAHDSAAFRNSCQRRQVSLSV
jgi:hypothetical protein